MLLIKKQSMQCIVRFNRKLLSRILSTKGCQHRYYGGYGDSYGGGDDRRNDGGREDHRRPYERRDQRLYGGGHDEHRRHERYDRGGQNSYGGQGGGPQRSFGGQGGFGSRDAMANLGNNLQSINWKDEQLVQITKNFYHPTDAVENRTLEEISQILIEKKITLRGAPPIPKPILHFNEAGFPEYLASQLNAADIKVPSAIQIMGFPVALSGRDMVGIAQTGSGKTLAYILPSIIHINAQPPLKAGDGPIVLVLAPTRELVMQIQKVAYQYGSTSNLTSAGVFGGVARHAQASELRRGVETVVATPGRLLDFLDSGVTHLRRVTYLVLDEADRMLDMGFGEQIRKIVSQIRPDRQTSMWSATWPQQVVSLARDFCKEDPVKVTVGAERLQANPQIQQQVIVSPEVEKRNRFLEWMRQNSKSRRTLVFVETRKGADTLARELRYQNFAVAALHGEKEQRERDRILSDFRVGRVDCLIATDVASRGLDIQNIDYVVNYDMPKNIEDYIHRIGRTARADKTGTSVSFFSYDYFTPEKARFAQDLAGVIIDAGQEVPQDLMNITGKKNVRRL